MGLRFLLHLALLGLGNIGPLVQGPNFRVLAVGVEEQEVIQIPSNGSAPLLVSAHVFVSNVFNVDILRYTVSYVLMLRLAWLDARLAWNGTMYSRQVVTLPTNLLWTPELSIREALWTDWKDENPQATVGQDGHVEVNLALTTEANCDFELLHFPRDQSSCNLSFFVFSNSDTFTMEGKLTAPLSSQTASVPPALVKELEFQVQVTNEIVSIKREYVVDAVETQVLKEQLVPCFQVTLSLRNTALKSIIALIVPGEGLLLADMCGGLLPLQAFERMAYKVTLLLGYLVFHSSLVHGLPSSSSCNPLLTYFFTILLLLLLLSTVETVLLAGMLARDTLRAGHSPSPAPEPDTKDPRRGGEGSRRKWLEAADHVFFLVYVASVLCTQVIFVAIWIWATCKSDPPPGMDGPHGGQPSMWHGGLEQLISGQRVGS